MFYSPSTSGFYDPEIHGDNVPADAVEITREEHAALMLAQSSGKVIEACEDGKPIAVERPEPSVRDKALGAIRELEASITPRRMREAILGNDGGWLADIEAQIEALRAEV